MPFYFPLLTTFQYCCPSQQPIISNFKLMDQPKIMVAIRKRPLFKKEVAKGEKDVL